MNFIEVKENEFINLDYVMRFERTAYSWQNHGVTNKEYHIDFLFLDGESETYKDNDGKIIEKVKKLVDKNDSH